MKKLNKIKVIVSFNNPGESFDICINNLLTQDYENYEVLFIDDFSTDSSYDKIPSGEYQKDSDNNPIKDKNGEIVIKYNHPLLQKTKCSNIQAWRSNHKNGCVGNFYNGVINFCSDEDIVVLLDGKDWLINKTVLSKINSIYSENENILVTFGSHKKVTGNPKAINKSFDKDAFEAMRIDFFDFQNPISFRAGLFRKLIEKDPELTNFKDSNGNIFSDNYEPVFMLPLIELAGFDRVKHIEERLYVFNNLEIMDEMKKFDVYDELTKKNRLKEIKNFHKSEETKNG